MEDKSMPKTEVDVKKVSPLDSREVVPLDLVQIQPAAKLHWVPSKYNLRTTADDGRYIVWNSYTAAISIFNPQQRKAIQSLLKGGYEGEARRVIKWESPVPWAGYKPTFDHAPPRQKTGFAMNSC